MATTIVTKYGSDAPATTDIVRGELAVDTENGRLYTENAAGAVVEIGLKPEANVDVTGTITASGEITANGGIALGDNDKATFGAGDDLQIYHDGSNSYIKDSGTGDLLIEGSDNIWLMKAGGSEVFLNTADDGAVTLYHNNAAKLATTSTGIDVTGEITADGLALGDSQKATFGASDDLQIFHDAAGGHSRIDDTGTGNLVLRAASALVVEKYGGDTMANFANDGAVTFYYDNAAKIATTATGIDVTGDTDTSGLFRFGVNNSEIANNYVRFKPTGAAYIDHNTVGQVINFRLSASSTLDTTPLVVSSTGIDVNGTINAYRAGFTQGVQLLGDSGGNQIIGTATNDKKLIIKNQAATQGIEIVAGNRAMSIAKGGDISFYEDTGTTPKLFWDASAESLGIGTASPSKTLDIRTNSSGEAAVLKISNEYTGGTAVASMEFGQTSGTAKASIAAAVYNDGFMAFRTNDNTEKMRIDASGNVLVGKTAVDFGTVGAEILPTGVIRSAVGGGYCLMVNRKDSDGEIINFRKDSATVGSISTQGGDLNIGTGACGIAFVDGVPALYPWTTTGNTTNDNAIDLGDSGARFKDLYLSGNANVNIAYVETSIVHAGDTDTSIDFSGANDLRIYAGGVEHAAFDGTIVFNQSGADMDFRVESPTNTHALFLEGSSSNFHINATTVPGANNSGFLFTTDQLYTSAGTNTSYNYQVRFYNGNGLVGSISTNGSATSFNTSSDARLKQNIVDAPAASDDIDAMQVRSFDWKVDGEHQTYGMIAQELIEVAPDAVSGDEESEEMMAVDYSKLVPMLVKEIQQLRQRVAQLEE